MKWSFFLWIIQIRIKKRRIKRRWTIVCHSIYLNAAVTLIVHSMQHRWNTFSLSNVATNLNLVFQREVLKEIYFVPVSPCDLSSWANNRHVSFCQQDISVLDNKFLFAYHLCHGSTSPWWPLSTFFLLIFNFNLFFV